MHPNLYYYILTSLSQIVGGTETWVGEFPFSVLIGDTERENWVCSGVLLNTQFVLTAAHCKETSVENFKLRLGVHFVAGEKEHNRNDPHVQNFDIPSKNFVIHWDFTKENNVVKNDIALIKLPRPAKLNSLAQPACWKTQAPINSNPVLVGWGKTDNIISYKIGGLYSNKQYKVEVMVIRFHNFQSR